VDNDLLPTWLPAAASLQGPQTAPIDDGDVLANVANMGAAANRPSTRMEIALGRALAVCVHPIAAWRTRPEYRRRLMLSGCFTASYILVLVALRLLSAVPKP
jgi:hypothetical protein